MHSIEKENLETGKVKINCVKCGRCMDACPVNAISYHIKGTRVESRAFYFIAKYTFRYLGFFLMATMAGGMINSSLFRIYKLITTGSILIGS